MNTLGLLALIFVACLVFYLLARSSGNGAIHTTPSKLPDIPEKIIDEQKMLPALMRLPLGELGIIKLTVVMMVEVVREMDSEIMIRMVKHPMQQFEMLLTRHILKVRLPRDVATMVTDLFFKEVFPPSLGLCVNGDTRANLPEAIKLFGVEEADAKLFADWCGAVEDSRPLIERANSKEFQDSSNAMIEMAVNSLNLSEFTIRLHTVLHEEYLAGKSESDSSKDAPMVARTVWDSETVRLSRECVARLRAKKEVEQWLRQNATSPFTYVQVLCAVQRINWESTK